MAIPATEFTNFNGQEGDTADSIEKEIDEKLKTAIEEAIKKGQPQLQFRYEFSTPSSRRVREEVRRRYEAAGWDAGWTNTETLQGIYLSKVVRDRRRR
jgi:hypothetical protein